jgi:hypothetical protein
MLQTTTHYNPLPHWWLNINQSSHGHEELVKLINEAGINHSEFRKWTSVIRTHTSSTSTNPQRTAWQLQNRGLRCMQWRLTQLNFKFRRKCGKIGSAGSTTSVLAQRLPKKNMSHSTSSTTARHLSQSGPYFSWRMIEVQPVSHTSTTRQSLCNWHH